MNSYFSFVCFVCLANPILWMKQRSVMKPTMNAKDIPVLLKHYSKKDSGTILETSSIKFMRSALNLQSIFVLMVSYTYLMV